MTTTFRIGLLGFGSVGSSLATIVQQQQAELERRTGIRFSIVAVARRKWLTKPDVDFILETDPMAVAVRNDVDLVVELMGGTDVAKEAILAAIQAGKPVVTANKAVLSEHGDTIVSAAASAGVPVRFEAAVAGAIPVLKAVAESLGADKIQSVRGILNGTCNYILTRMEQEGATYQDVLADAQALGYAEADPGADVDGWDTAHKVSVLSRLAFETGIDVQQIRVRGIRDVTGYDIEAASELGARIKLIGQALHKDDHIEAQVEPMLVPLDKTLATPDGPTNAVEVTGLYAGELSFVGPGAGGFPTANAVMNDILTLALRHEYEAPILNTGFQIDNSVSLPVRSATEQRHYVRFRVVDATGTMALISSHFAEAGINLRSILQHGEEKLTGKMNVVLTTSKTSRVLLEQTVQEICNQVEVSESRIYPLLDGQEDER